ncbi:MAG: pantothenate kinase [Legionellales bacterium RIFCSPHIGHO2_12_FULL_37_14]|nr:MAG: pantothenate kinase [Legionellales bacterium RIFCSPHIGHO2_12_FULL_37_14]
MILCVDVGNSHIYGGVFDDDKLILKFRHTSVTATSDMLGLFLKQVLQENGCNPKKIRCISVASVVPSLDYSLRSACVKYFSLEPFILQAGVKTGLKIKCKNPVEVGADRIANAIASVAAFPQKNLIVLDFGTATTVCAIAKDKSYLGGSIMPGIRLSVDALSEKTAKLPSVEIIKMAQAVGRTTVENIQAGIFLGAVGACKELIARIKADVFTQEDPIVLATGGFASLFEGENLYDHLMPDLVLDGLRLAVSMSASLGFII